MRSAWRHGHKARTLGVGRRVLTILYGGVRAGSALSAAGRPHARENKSASSLRRACVAARHWALRSRSCTGPTGAGRVLRHSACARKPAGWGRRPSQRCPVAAGALCRPSAPRGTCAPPHRCLKPLRMRCVIARRRRARAARRSRRDAGSASAARTRRTDWRRRTACSAAQCVAHAGLQMRACACNCAVGAVLRVGPSQAGELAGAVRRLRALRRSRLKSLRLLISLTSTPTLLIAIERDWQQ